MEKSEPKVLIAAPSSIRHRYVVDDWYKAIRNLNYPQDKIDVVVVENTSEEKDPHEEYYAHLKNLGIRVIRYPWLAENQEVVRMLATCREIYRQIAYFEKYDYLFHVDTDTILEPDTLKKLISRDKDMIGPVVHVYGGNSGLAKRPCVFKQTGVMMKKTKDSEAGLFYYSWQELAAIKKKLRNQKKPLICKVPAAALGCLLVKRKVFERIAFTSHHSLIMGEDLWFQYNVDHYNDKNKGKEFEWWIDFTVNPEHRNTDWAFSLEKKKMMQTWYLWHGWQK